jgi:hypothetical protein
VIDVAVSIELRYRCCTGNLDATERELAIRSEVGVRDGSLTSIKVKR